MRSSAQTERAGGENDCLCFFSPSRVGLDVFVLDLRFLDLALAPGRRRLLQEQALQGGLSLAFAAAAAAAASDEEEADLHLPHQDDRRRKKKARRRPRQAPRPLDAFFFFSF